MPYCKKSTREKIYIDYKSGMSRPDICSVLKEEIIDND